MSDSGELVKMKVTGYSDNTFSSEVDHLEVQINPASLKYQKGISYSENKTMGTQTPAKEFDKAKATNLSFDCLFDETGVLPLEGGIIGVINHLEQVAYTINGEIHRPNFVVVSWGSFIFKGQLSSVSYDYSLFRPDGSPLRVKVSISIEGYMDPLTERKKAGLKSPDLTRFLSLRAGENIPLLCARIYGDASYCTDIARINRLKGFRDVKPGTKLIFPPLQRND